MMIRQNIKISVLHIVVANEKGFLHYRRPNLDGNSNVARDDGLHSIIDGHQDRWQLQKQPDGSAGGYGGGGEGARES